CSGSAVRPMPCCVSAGEEVRSGGGGQREGDGGAPRDNGGEGAVVVGGVESGAAQAGGEGVEVVAAGQGGRDVGEAERGRAGAGPAAVPRVHGDVVVVATGGGEDRAGMTAGGGLEAEGVDIEAPRGLDVADLQVHVADDPGTETGRGLDILGE